MKSMKQSSQSLVEITIITTGGTIEKTYDETDGILLNRESIIKKKILTRLRLPYTRIFVHSILAMDSLDMTDRDRHIVLLSIQQHLIQKRPVVVLHGTDTMELSAQYCFKELSNLEVPVVFTGAMKPLGFDDSDAMQNVTEALLACQFLDPGVYISFHNRIYKVPGVRKNKKKRTFESY